MLKCIGPSDPLRPDVAGNCKGFCRPDQEPITYKIYKTSGTTTYLSSSQLKCANPCPPGTATYGPEPYKCLKDTYVPSTSRYSTTKTKIADYLVDRPSSPTFTCSDIRYDPNTTKWCSDFMSKVDPRFSSIVTSACANALSQGIVYPGCNKYLDYVTPGNTGAADNTSLHFRFCSKALEVMGTMPDNCYKMLNPNQKNALFTNVCNLNPKTLQTPECKSFCRDNFKACLPNIRGYCNNADTILSDPFCQDALSKPEAWGKFDDLVPELCRKNEKVKALEICNCLNPDKLDKFKNQFDDSQKPLVRAECLMPECISSSKKVYLTDTQKDSRCPPVCYQGNQLDLKDSRIGNVNLVQNCSDGLGKTTAPQLHCQVSAWTDWSDCDISCGTGIKKRTRTVTQNPSNGGLACPTLEDAQVCVANNCPKAFSVETLLERPYVYGVAGLIVFLILLLIIL
jgi:hypothetical protein